MQEQLETWGNHIDEAALILALVLFAIEIARDLIRWRGAGRRLLDSLSSLSTQIPFTLFELATFAGTIAVYYFVQERLAPVQIPTTAWTIVLAVLAADFAYYWEHRWAHEIRIFWVGHAVHHSSRIMNTSVAFRFGFFEGVIALLVHLPLVLIGFDPLLVIFGQVLVLAYQTWIHTELIGRLGPLDAVLNTPSNHRVHHGCDAKYLDKNYGGILMVWDRIFGTYQAEEETPRYGLARDFDSVNPLEVWFSELPALFRDLAATRSPRRMLAVLFGRPGGSHQPQEHQP